MKTSLAAQKVTPWIQDSDYNLGHTTQMAFFTMSSVILYFARTAIGKDKRYKISR